ncbi:hypothetical protein [Flavobacterium sp.]|uniref:hypothetical protein n=1 Tax=Flavobacterium sp. TaxID=239 RepID=UPI0039E48653
MKPDNYRACIYPKDIQRIMGKEDKSARRYLKKIKEHLKKQPHQFVSITEFSAYSGIPIDEVRNGMC